MVFLATNIMHERFLPQVVCLGIEICTYRECGTTNPFLINPKKLRQGDPIPLDPFISVGNVLAILIQSAKANDASSS
jgi:hypothetical protein